MTADRLDNLQVQPIPAPHLLITTKPYSTSCKIVNLRVSVNSQRNFGRCLHPARRPSAVRSRSGSYRARELNFLSGASFDLSEALLELLKIRNVPGIRANVGATDGVFAIDHVGSTPANAFESSELVVQTLIVAAHPAVVVAQKCERKPQVFPRSREHKRAVCGNAKTLQSRSSYSTE